MKPALYFHVCGCILIRNFLLQYLGKLQNYCSVFLLK